MTIKISEWIKRAKQDDIEAQNHLGLLYRDGEIQDYAIPLKWFLGSAKKGNAKSQNILGNIYRDGKRETYNAEKAFKWYEKAAKQDDIEACNSLGEMYRDGEGVEKDYDEAEHWFKKSFELSEKEVFIINVDKFFSMETSELEEIFRHKTPSLNYFLYYVLFFMGNAICSSQRLFRLIFSIVHETDLFKDVAYVEGQTVQEIFERASIEECISMPYIHYMAYAAREERTELLFGLYAPDSIAEVAIDQKRLREEYEKLNPSYTDISKIPAFDEVQVRKSLFNLRLELAKRYIYQQYATLKNYNSLDAHKMYSLYWEEFSDEEIPKSTIEFRTEALAASDISKIEDDIKKVIDKYSVEQLEEEAVKIGLAAQNYNERNTLFYLATRMQLGLPINEHIILQQEYKSFDKEELSGHLGLAIDKEASKKAKEEGKKNVYKHIDKEGFMHDNSGHIAIYPYLTHFIKIFNVPKKRRDGNGLLVNNFDNLDNLMKLLTFHIPENTKKRKKAKLVQKQLIAALSGVKMLRSEIRKAREAKISIQELIDRVDLSITKEKITHIKDRIASKIWDEIDIEDYKRGKRRLLGSKRFTLRAALRETARLELDAKKNTILRYIKLSNYDEQMEILRLQIRKMLYQMAKEFFSAIRSVDDTNYAIEEIRRRENEVPRLIEEYYPERRGRSIRGILTKAIVGYSIDNIQKRTLREKGRIHDKNKLVG